MTTCIPTFNGRVSINPVGYRVAMLLPDGTRVEGLVIGVTRERGEDRLVVRDWQPLPGHYSERATWPVNPSPADVRVVSRPAIV